MIKFFRKIRQRLLTENKFSKYLFYAIGEIVLVVIGILIALSINNWNVNRINQQKEINILNELKIEYQEKLTELDQKVELRNLMISSSSQLLLLIKNEDYNITQDSLSILAALTMLSPTFDATNSVTDELLNTGNLYLISNKQLRKLILDWSSQLDKLDEEENTIVNILINQYIPYLSKRIPYNTMVSYFLNENKDVWKYIMKSTQTEKYIISKSNKIVDVKSLFQDIEFESYLSTINFNSIVANMQSENLRSHIANVMELLDNELNEKSKQ